jgi:hypothetical protein
MLNMLSDRDPAAAVNSGHRLRLHWMREPSLGVLRAEPLPDIAAHLEPLANQISETIAIPLDRAHDLAGKILACVPEAAGRCLEVRRASPDSGALIDVQFPVLTRKHWKDRLALAEQLHPQIDDDGRIIAENGAESRIETLARVALAAGMPSSSKDFDMSFTDTRTLSACQAHISLPLLLAHYGFRSEDIDAIEHISLGGELQVSLTLSLAGECARAWLSAPEERSADFFATYSQMSKAVQGALRRWVPYLFFHDGDQYGDSEHGIPLAVYQGLRPYRGKPRSSFTFDVLNPELMALAYRLATRDIGPVAERIRAFLIGNNFSAIARHYQPSRLRSLVDLTAKQRRSFNSLLVGDSLLIEAFVKLGVDAHDVGCLVQNGQGAAKAISNAADSFVKTCHLRLKRLYAGKDFQCLLPVLLMEATRALRPEFPISASLRLRRSGGTSHVFRNV